MPYRRTLAALFLTLVAVAVPSAIWFFVGQRQLERELHLHEKAVYSRANKKGVALAERLAGRLDLLLEMESRRPFYHYQNLFHDPRGAAEGISVTVSPLAHGAADPLIRAHFQIDDDGRLTLPTINDRFPELGLESTDSAHCQILEELRDVAYFSLGELDDYSLVAAAADRGAGDGETVKVTMSARAWHQHLEANTLYAELKSTERRGPGRSGRLIGPEDDGGTVEIQVAPFRWYTLPVGEEPGLVALRKVETPVGTWTQGFAISSATVLDTFSNPDYPATFVPLDALRSERHTGQVVHPVDETSWGVALELGDGLERAVADAAAARRRFLALFLVGASAAFVAGLLVVTMVYQSERLALQRAQFAASAAHELRTPLAGLRLYGEMLADGLGSPDKARKYARRMAGEAERLGRVVTNVLSFTRLERKSLSVHPEPGDLAAAVGAALKRQQPALEEAGAEVALDVAPDLPEVRFDADAVTHILQNLLDNAEKYTRGVPGRRIEVSLAEVGNANGNGTTNGNGHANGTGNGSRRVALKVADNGPGVTPELRRRLFVAYSRGQHDDAEGLGLGLVLVKALTDAQDGEIRYRDRDGGGAEFTVTFSG